MVGEPARVAGAVALVRRDADAVAGAATESLPAASATWPALAAYDVTPDASIALVLRVGDGGALGDDEQRLLARALRARGATAALTVPTMLRFADGRWRAPAPSDAARDDDAERR